MKKILLALAIVVSAITISAQTNSRIENITYDITYDTIYVEDTIYLYDTVYEKYRWNEEHSMLEKVYYGDLEMADGKQDYLNYYMPTINVGIVERVKSYFRVTI